MRFSEPGLIDKRLEDDSMPVPECGCQIWLGAVSQNGYGALKVNNKQISVHRLSWMRNRGPIPDGLQVLHHCDLRSCIRPDHLFLGTQKDNMTDMGRKGRKAIMLGSASPNAKLSEADVLAIRSDSRLGREIAADYGIDASNVTKIKSRRNWAHLP